MICRHTDPDRSQPRSFEWIRRLDAADVVAGFVEEEADDLLGFGVFAFAEVAEAEVAFGVEHVFGGPVAVGEVAPGLVVVVLDDEPAEVVPFGGFTHVVDALLEIEFGSVHS